MSFITSLISISSLATWIFLPLNAIFLTLDGIVYSLVAYSYKIFMLIAQLNYNVLYAWISPLLDRVKAIILVFIMFKVGYALIQYMINPDSLDDTAKGGPALIKNIAIASAMLIVYTFVFSFMNELTLLMIGVPEGYEFTTLKQVAEVTNNGKDSGLIARFIFGADADNVGDFGKKLSVNTLNIFLHSKDGQTSDLDNIYNELSNGDMNAFDAMKIVTIVARIDKDVEYKWPLISTITGLYLTWQIIKLAIELAIRMFKLMVLQVLAPLAIVSIVDGGTKNNTWSGYVKTFFGTWMDAFIRVGSLYLATALVGKFWVEKSELMPEATGITKGLIFLIIMFSAYKCVELIPQLIKQVFPNMGTSGDNAKGFGGLLGGMAGLAIGAGARGYAAVKAGTGVGGFLTSTLSGAYDGARAGGKSANVVDFFKKQATSARAGAEIALQNKKAGGVGNRLRNNLLAATGAAAIINDKVENGEGGIKEINENYESAVSAENKDYADKIAAAEAEYENTRAQLESNLNQATSTMSSSDSGFTYANGDSITFGEDKGQFVSDAVSNDADVIKYRNLIDQETAVQRSGTLRGDALQYSAEQMASYKQQYETAKRKAAEKANSAWSSKEAELEIGTIKQNQKNLESSYTEQKKTLEKTHKEKLDTLDKDHKTALDAKNKEKIPVGK